MAKESMKSASVSLARLGVERAGAAKRFFFRAPFGERTPDVLAALRRGGFEDMLWNIDSRNWSPHVDGPAATHRVTALMLTKRRGILLFHDVFPTARIALPEILSSLGKAGITWLDCHAVPGG